MVNRRKIIYDFLPQTDRLRLTRELSNLRTINNVEYNEINDRQEIINSLTNLTTFTDPLIIQIIAHGNCDGFGVDRDNFVLYSDLSDLLRQINQSTNNRLILNLMTVCCSIYQLTFFNKGQQRLFEIIIGCTKGAFVHGAIGHSVDIHNTLLPNLRNRVEQMNEDLDDEFSPDRRETITYMIG
jgi:hypothetical protein